MIRPVLFAAALALASPALAQHEGHGAALTQPRPAEDAALKAVIEARSEADRSRDAYRRPVEALTFWGLRPGMTVLEIQPGQGWWTEILAPYAKATGGRYISTAPDLANPKLSDAGKKARADLEAKLKDPKYGEVTLVNWGPVAAPLPAPGTVDLVLSARNFHGWAQQEGFADKAMKEIATVLKPGGVLAVEQHRAAPGQSKPATGYVAEADVIAAAERAGLKLDARSELNANPKDDRDHPFGVWTLQPVRQSKSGEGGTGAELTPEQRAEYDAIGESDRMTLRFVKPTA